MDRAAEFCSNHPHSDGFERARDAFRDVEDAIEKEFMQSIDKCTIPYSQLLEKAKQGRVPMRVVHTTWVGDDAEMDVNIKVEVTGDTYVVDLEEIDLEVDDFVDVLDDMRGFLFHFFTTCGVVSPGQLVFVVGCQSNTTENC